MYSHTQKTDSFLVFKTQEEASSNAELMQTALSSEAPATVNYAKIESQGVQARNLHLCGQ